MGVLLLFFDGIGIGEDDPARNPFAGSGSGSLSAAAGRPPGDPWVFARLDPGLETPGLPQSATGQTALFTGLPAWRVAGRHQTGLPGPSLRPLIEEHSLFRRLRAAGARPTFANAFTPEHLEAPRPRWSVTTRMTLAAGIPFRFLDPHERRDQALPHDYTGDWLHRLGAHTARRRSASQAAAVLRSLLEAHDLVLYEYFLTDLVGHRGSWDQRRLQALRAAALVDAAAEALAGSQHTLVVTSDHGNLEASDHSRHTRNAVPLLARGPLAESIAGRARSLTDVTPALVRVLGSRAGRDGGS